MSGNLFAAFAERFDRWGDKDAVITDSGTRLSFAELDQHSARIAGALTRLGVVKGDRVTAQVHKSPEALCLYLACLRAGAVFHPLNTGYQPAELAYFVGNAEPKVIVTDPASLDLFCGLPGSPQAVLTLDRSGLGTLSDAAADHADTFRNVSCNADDSAALLYSSGTTGQPKGIDLSHGNLLSNAQVLTDWWQFSERDVLLHALPIFHVHGLFVAVGCALLSGASMRWQAGFSVDAVIDALPDCSVMMGVPTYYTRLLASPRFTREVSADRRLYISGSAPLLAETFEAFEAQTGHRIVERYGLTETVINTSSPLDGDRKAGTVGVPLPGVELRVVDDAGHSLGPGETGQIEVRGPNVFRGYWRMPDKTREDFTGDGFFRTGDNGEWDNDGYLAIVGRAKDMVISGGLNVYPREVELLLDGLEGVAESAVIGVPHPDFGEAVVAVIVPQEGATLDEAVLRDALKPLIAAFKVPKRITTLGELPRNTMGKVQKNELRDRYRGLFEAKA
ncbi:MAG: malonyl-CoA synthase [Pseudomonadota bacterium]